MDVFVTDAVAGLSRYRLAIMLAWEDLMDRYRRSYLGVTWIILSFLAFVVVKALIFSGVFDTPDYDFFSHLVIGFALFGFISSIINAGSNLFFQNRTWILSTNVPYTVYIHSLILRAFFELGLVGAAAAVLVLAMGNPQPAFLWSTLFAVPVLYMSAFGICLMFAPIGARFRDFVHAVQTVMRVMFFATPIIWVPTPGTLRATIANWNPLTYYLDIVRVPIIEGRIPVASWMVVLAIMMITLFAGIVIFSMTKRRIPLLL